MSIKMNLDEMVREKLYDEIISGKWVLGEPISIDKIMAEYGVSRTPVIQALKKMLSSGLVDFSNTGHYSVPRFSNKDISDIMSMRVLMEEQAIREIESNRISIDFDELYGINESGELGIKNKDSLMTRREDLRFHKSLVDQAGNKCLSDLYSVVQEKFMMVNYTIAVHPLNQQEIAFNDHAKVINLLSDGNYDEALEVLKHHITWAYQKIKIRITEEN